MPLLGAIPLDAKTVGLGDMGRTFVEYETPAVEAFFRVVDVLLLRLERREALVTCYNQC
jgi:hypothetical protein